MSYCPFYMIIVDHFIESTLVVAQQQASGEVSTDCYTITVDHLMESTLVVAQVVRYLYKFIYLIHIMLKNQCTSCSSLLLHSLTHGQQQRHLI